MLHIRRPLYLLATFTLLVSSCQSTPELNVDRKIVSEGNPIVSALFNSPSDENNECLNCHAAKDRLIETAKPEAPAESESKGVG